MTCSCIISINLITLYYIIRWTKVEEEPNDSLPTSYDWRKTWSVCSHKIKDQAQCGSCWSFAGSTALAYRFCQASKGKVNVVLSPQDSISCDKGNNGCNGGGRLNTWNYYAKTGIVKESCFPYSSRGGTVEKCVTKCKNGAAWKKYKAKNVKAIAGENAIKTELINNGPVHTGFTVYQDFMNYKSGIYKHVSGSSLGGHAVVIIGYGVSNGTKYWICQNSWGANWGENGFFRIKIGDCGIDSNAAVGVPVL